MSNLFKSVQGIFPNWLPVPLPKPFVEGLDMAKYYDQLGGGYDNISSFGKVTILNKEATGGSFWYYYFISLFYKTPISILIFFISSIILVAKQSWKRFIKNEFFLLFPIVYFLFVFSFFYKTQCGIRHLIFIYPFIFIMSSGIIPHLRNVYIKSTTVALTSFLVISVSFYWKNYYPYTNELISDKKMAYAYVGAGNLEFLQAKFFYADYLHQHPGVSSITQQPKVGIFLVNTEDYLDIWNRHRYDWIRNIKPTGHVAFSGLLIKVSAKDLAANESPR
jgi:hypothetical protein